MLRKLMLVATAGVLAIALSGGAATAASGPTVKATNYEFTPKTISIGQGETVTWKNKEGSHTVTFRTIGFDKALSGNGKVSKTFKNTGTYKYYCIPHEDLGMKGKVIVGDV